MTLEQFNIKHKDKIEEGFQGLMINNQEVINYLDKEFESLPNLIFSQIKIKFNWVCFYCNLNVDERIRIETEIKNILKL